MRASYTNAWRTFVVLAVILATTLSSAQPQSSRKMTRTGEDQIVSRENALVHAHWRGPALVGIEENSLAEPLLYKMEKEGRYERIRFRIPGAGYIHLDEIAGGADGTIAVSGSANTTDGKAATFVSRIAPDGQHQTVTRVWPYCPRKVAVDQDGNIWTVGWVLNEAGYISEGNVLKRFDKSGRVLSSVSVQARSRFRRDAVEYSNLGASADRVGWFTNANEYIEFSQDGREIFRIDGPPITGEHNIVSLSLALSDSNQVVVGAYGRKQWDVWLLDREKRTWDPIELSDRKQPKWGRLLGFDGPHLVTREEGGVVRRYRID